MDKIFNKPFAINGARVAIPENGTENERVSFDKGFTQPYEVEAPSVDNPAGQGFNILRPEMNEALYQLSSACNFLAENIDKWTALTTENLNNITQKGRYFQATQSQATNANNYPTNETGYLIVFDSINGNVSQFYKVANSNVFYIRYKQGDIWGGWDIFAPVKQRRWVNEKPNRRTNVVYTNTNSYEIIVCVTFDGNNQAQSVYVDDVRVGYVYDGQTASPITFVVPPNSTYKVQQPTAVSWDPIPCWVEYK